MMQPPIPSDQPLPAGAPPVIPAATVVVFRRNPAGGPPQLLMLRRAPEMRFAGGAAVFPGGRVDPADRDLARQLCPDAPPEIAAARIAAIRETLEEAGLLLATRSPVTADDAAQARAMLLGGATLADVLDRFGWDLAPETLALYAHWCPLWTGAFDTRFFVYDLGTGAVDVTVDATENTQVFWTSAPDALAMAERGDIIVIFPTKRNLERLARFATYTDALADIAAHPVTRIHPRTEIRNGDEWIVIPDGCGYAVLGEPRSTALRG